MEEGGALGPGVLEAREGAGGDAGLGLQDLGGLAGQGGAADLVAGLLVGGREGARRGGLAGVGAADDLGEVGTGRGVQDGGALLGREAGSGAVEGGARGSGARRRRSREATPATAASSRASASRYSRVV
jgi:hypothetical protein